MRNVQLLPTGVHVSVAYPPDTDTPGYANENTTKACIVPDTPPVLHNRFIIHALHCREYHLSGPLLCRLHQPYFLGLRGRYPSIFLG